MTELSRTLPERATSSNSSTPSADKNEETYHCPTCRSQGFLRSPMKNRCSFCDGTEGGHPPTAEEIVDWNWHKSSDDPCDEMMP